MKKQELQNNSSHHILRFEKASPEALKAILNALNSEVDEARVQKRFPTVEGTFSKLIPTHSLTSLI